MTLAQKFKKLKAFLESNDSQNFNLLSQQLKFEVKTKTDHLLLEKIIRTFAEKNTEKNLDTLVSKKYISEKPLVSIITVVRNCESTIERCILSVVNQSYDNIEYIIIDGLSTDNTLKVVDKYKKNIKKIVSEKDSGIYNAMNKGLALATGEIISFLNADDFYFINAVEASVENLKNNNCEISYGSFLYRNSDGYAVLADENRNWDESILIRGIPGGHETIFALKNVYERIGFYDEKFRLAADYDWLTRCFLGGIKAKSLNKIILVMDTGGMSFNADIEYQENLKILKNIFPELPEGIAELLYKFKFYKNWDGFSLHDHDIFYLYHNFLSSNHLFKKSFSKTIFYEKNIRKGKIKPTYDNSKINICIALTYLQNSSGGAERIAIEAANKLHKEGFNVTVVSASGIAAEPFYKLNNEITYLDIAIKPYAEFYLNKSEYLDLKLDSLKERYEGLDYTPNQNDVDDWNKSPQQWLSRLYRGFLNAHKFDVVISHMPSTWLYVLNDRDFSQNTLHIACLHNAPKFKFFSTLYPCETNLERYMRIHSLRNADKVSVLFDEFIDQLPSVFKKSSFTLPNFINEEFKNDGNSKFKFKTILNIGRLSVQKDQASLIRVFSKLKKKFPDWHLKIYGDGPLKQELISLCDELNLKHEDILMGATKDVISVYKKSSIFAFPSIFEGFGLTAVEAMRFGLPVIAMEDCDGIKYIVKNLEDGLLIKSTDKDSELYKALDHLMSNNSVFENLSKKAEVNSYKYTIGSHTNSLLSIINEMNFKFRKNKVNPNIEEKNIAICSTYLEGGAGIAAARLAKGLENIGQNIAIFSLSDTKNYKNYFLKLDEENNETLKKSNLLNSKEIKKRGSPYFSSSLPSVDKNLIDVLLNFDVINLHWIENIINNELIYLLLTNNKKIVWTLHDMKPFTGGCHYSGDCFQFVESCTNCPQLISEKFKAYPEIILDEKINLFGKNLTIITPSSWLAEEAKASRLFSGNNIFVIPNGIDLNVYKPTGKFRAREFFNLPQNLKIILFACQSNSEERKGFQFLIELSKNLKQKNILCHVITLGEPSEDLKKLELPYTSLGHIGEDWKIAVAYSAADVCVLPSMEDNLPNVILESVSCGTPVVAFDSGGISDAVIPNVTGYLAKPRDSEDLAKLVIKTLNEDFAESCRSYAEKWFDIKLMSKRYNDLFDLLSNENLENPNVLYNNSFFKKAFNIISKN
jgi:glycosyltransferase involved in cell wall biosynthesis